MYKNIRVDPKIFCESFLSEIAQPKINVEFDPIIRILLFYIWRGCELSREAGLTGKVEPNIALLSLSCYEEFLGIIQLTRLGYQADAIILFRSLMERIAIIGYLGEKMELIPRYFSGNLNPYSEAFSWAKKKPLSNWNILYSTFSKIVHSGIEGPAGHINNRNTIGNAFRENPSKDPLNDAEMAEELIACAIYSLIALDPLAMLLILNEDVEPFSSPTDIINNVGQDEYNKMVEFLHSFIEKYKKLNSQKST